MKKLMSILILVILAACLLACATPMTEDQKLDRDIARTDTIEKYWLCRQAYKAHGVAWVVIDRDWDDDPDYFDMRREINLNRCLISL